MSPCHLAFSPVLHIPSSVSLLLSTVPEEMKRILSQVSDSLELYPPTNGGVNMKRLSESAPSPTSCRRSVVEMDVHAKKLKNQHSISAPILV